MRNRIKYIIVGSALVLATVAFAYSRKVSTRPTETGSPKPAESERSSSSLANTETMEEWNSYKNGKSGYEISYGPTWELHEGLNVTTFKPPEYPGHMFTVDVLPSTVDLPSFERSHNLQLYDVAINGLSGKRNDYLVYIPHKNHLYTIVRDDFGNPVTPALDKLFDRFVSSFRVLD